MISWMMLNLSRKNLSQVIRVIKQNHNQSRNRNVMTLKIVGAKNQNPLSALNQNKKLKL